MAKRSGGSSNPFNERELEILRRIAEGQSNREIADQLYLSVNTVRWYNKQIYEKLETHSRTTAIARARALGLIAVDGQEAVGEEQRAAQRFADEGGGGAGVDDLESIGPSSTPTNLPAQLTPFIGREREMAELAAHFADPAVRLVTIVGPGGMGKSRIAQEFARAQLAEFPHGVYWIALAPVTADGDDAHVAVMNTLASTLHITLHAGADPEAQIVTYLQKRQMLLVIDNFEHLLAGAGIVHRILESASGVRLIATSREALGLYGEAIYALGGLPVPDRDSADPWEYDSIRLFLQTARRVRGDFAAAESDLGEITRICTLADGLPLGIELAAAWARSLALPEIREQLEHGLDILESRTHNIRHVFDRSWHLLTESEQVAFARLSIFRGGCTREAIQSVTGASLRMIASLVDKSLLWHLPDGHYAMHELLRQYATEQLDRLSGEEAVQARHCDYYAALAGRWGRGVQGPRQLEGLAVLEQEYQNLYAAWMYAAQHGREEALRELLEMWYFFDIRARWREGEELYRAAAAGAEGLMRARLMTRQAVFTFRLGLNDHTRQLVEFSMETFREAGAEAELALPLLILGHLIFFQGDLDGAPAYYEQALALATRHNDPLIAVTALIRLGASALNAGDYAEGRSALQRGLELSRRTGDVMSTALALINLGELEALVGDIEAAAIYYRSALGTAQRIRQHYVIAGALAELGKVAFHHGRYEEAERLVEQSLSLHLEHGNIRFAVRCHAYLASIACAQDDYARANVHFLRAFEYTFEARAFGPGVRPLLFLADCFARQQDFARAVEIWTLVARYDGSSREQQEEAARRCEETIALIPTERFEAAARRGNGIDIETMLTSLMTELSAQAEATSAPRTGLSPRPVLR